MFAVSPLSSGFCLILIALTKTHLRPTVHYLSSDSQTYWAKLLDVYV
jgi:hypothetical protein